MGKLINVLFFLTYFSGMYAQNTTLTEAEELYENKRYKDAIPLFERYLSQENKDYEALSELGLAYFHIENYEKAREKFRLAALYTPVDKTELLASTYSNLSAAYSHSGDRQNAYKYAIKAYEMDKTSELNLWNASSTSIENFKYAEALKIMKQSNLQKNNAFNTLYGKAYFNIGEYEKSIEYYETFFQNYNPDDNSITLILTDEKKHYFKALLKILNQKGLSKEKFKKYEAAALQLYDPQDEEYAKDLSTDLAHSYKILNKDQKYLDFYRKYYNLCLPSATAIEASFLAFYLGYYDEMKTNAQRARSMTNVEDENLTNNIKTLVFIANLNLFLDEYEKNDKKYRDEDLKKLGIDFGNLFVGNKISEKELDDNPFYRALIELTCLSFIRRFMSNEEERVLGKESLMLIEIIKNIPNEEVVQQLTKEVSRLKNEN